MVEPDPPPPPPPFKCQLAFYPLGDPPATLCDFAYHAHPLPDGSDYPMGDVPDEIVVALGTCVVNTGVVLVQYDPVNQVVIVTPATRLDLRTRHSPLGRPALAEPEEKEDDMAGGWDLGDS